MEIAASNIVRSSAGRDRGKLFVHACESGYVPSMKVEEQLEVSGLGEKAVALIRDELLA